jgi:hypothetical protein
MRVLTVGFALPNASVDNYNALTAPSYYDYDAIVVDPESITRVARELAEGEKEFAAFDGRPILNFAASAAAVSAGDQLRRRGEEAQRFLENGGLIIVMARPNATYAGIVGFEGCDRYSWLPAPAGLSWSQPFLQAAEGRTVRIVDESHPATAVLREFRRELVYRATLNDRQTLLREQAKIIARGGAEVPIAAQFNVLSGRVLFLPVPNVNAGTSRQKLAQAMVNLCGELLGIAEEATVPAWARTLAVPGLEQIEAEVEEAEAAAREATERLAEVHERQQSLAAHRELLSGTGNRFQRAVKEGLGLLGFAVSGGAGDPMIAEADGEKAFIETESSREQVVEWPYIRLQRRLEELLLRHAERRKGIIVVNGENATAPDQRKKEFTDALRIASENYRYTLMTGQTLFGLVQRALGGAEAEALDGMRRRILRSSGLLELPAALGEAEEATDTGTIF